MEKKVLLYLLYSVLLQIRERSLENNDNVSFYLSDLLHNVPLILDSEDKIHGAYLDVIDKVKHLGIEQWLENRLIEFKEKYPDLGV